MATSLAVSNKKRTPTINSHAEKNCTDAHCPQNTQCSLAQRLIPWQTDKAAGQKGKIEQLEQERDDMQLQAERAGEEAGQEVGLSAELQE